MGTENCPEGKQDMAPRGLIAQGKAEHLQDGLSGTFRIGGMGAWAQGPEGITGRRLAASVDTGRNLRFTQLPGQYPHHTGTADPFPGSDSGHLSQYDAGPEAVGPRSCCVQPQTGLAMLPSGDRIPYCCLPVPRTQIPGLWEPADT